MQRVEACRFRGVPGEAAYPGVDGPRDRAIAGAKRSQLGLALLLIPVPLGDLFTRRVDPVRQRAKGAS